MFVNVKKTVLLIMGLILVFTTAVMAGEFWQYGEYNKTSESFRYKITTNKYDTTYGDYDEYGVDEEYEENGEYEDEIDGDEGGEEEETSGKKVETTVAFYEVSISRDDQRVDFSVTNEWNLPEEEFDGQDNMERLVGLYYGQYYNLPMMEMAGVLASNSMMFLMNVENLELEVGMMMSTWDGGLIKITGMETLAGQEGYLCEYFIKGEDESGKTVRTKISEWVISPTVSMPLATRIFAENTGDLLRSMELVNYTAVE